jgi:transcriptional regulator with XRE-family HTH domain
MNIMLRGTAMSHETIGTNLRRLRTARGVTQEDLAEAAGITRVAYRNVETGASLPRAETLRLWRGLWKLGSRIW